MLSGLSLEIVGVQTEEGCENYCRSCAIKKWGELRAQRIMAGLDVSGDWGAPRPLILYTAEEYATSNEENGEPGDDPTERCVECGTDLCLAGRAASTPEEET